MLIGLSLLAAGLAIEPKELIAEDVVPEEIRITMYSKDELVKKVYQYAETYKVNPKTIVAVISCENREWDKDLQSRIINKKGEREKSYGLSQIHLPSHPHISLEQATSPDFAIEFLAKNLSKGKGNMWTCYRNLKSNP